LHTFTLLVGTIGEPHNPRHSRRLHNLPPILGRVRSLTNSSAPPYHTPLSATFLGLALVGCTFLGSNTQGNPSIGSPSQGNGGQTSSQRKTTNPPNPSQGTSSLPTHTMVGTNPPPNLPFSYLSSLNIPDLTKLMNGPILHDATWPNIPTELPLDISKFEGKHTSPTKL
jgi:hypothetical protein